MKSDISYFELYLLSSRRSIGKIMVVQQWGLTSDRFANWSNVGIILIELDHFQTFFVFGKLNFNFLHKVWILSENAMLD